MGDPQKKITKKKYIRNSYKRNSKHNMGPLEIDNFVNACGYPSQIQWAGLCAYHALSNAFDVCVTFDVIEQIEKEYRIEFPSRWEIEYEKATTLLKNAYNEREEKFKDFNLNSFIISNRGTDLSFCKYLLEKIKKERFIVQTKVKDKNCVETFLNSKNEYEIGLRVQEKHVPLSVFRDFMLAIDVNKFYTHFYSRITKFKNDIDLRIKNRTSDNDIYYKIFSLNYKKEYPHAVALRRYRNTNKWCYIDSHQISAKLEEKDALEILNFSDEVIYSTGQSLKTPQPRANSTKKSKKSIKRK